MVPLIITNGRHWDGEVVVNLRRQSKRRNAQIRNNELEVLGALNHSLIAVHTLTNLLVLQERPTASQALNRLTRRHQTKFRPKLNRESPVESPDIRHRLLQQLRAELKRTSPPCSHVNRNLDGLGEHVSVVRSDDDGVERLAISVQRRFVQEEPIRMRNDSRHSCDSFTAAPVRENLIERPARCERKNVDRDRARLRVLAQGVQQRKRVRSDRGVRRIFDKVRRRVERFDKNRHRDLVRELRRGNHRGVRERVGSCEPFVRRVRHDCSRVDGNVHHEERRAVRRGEEAKLGQSSEEERLRALQRDRDEAILADSERVAKSCARGNVHAASDGTGSCGCRED
mmetsp:Transcript_30352/g.98674  ORF Transcript_30352/g.98674 Transcript_30352/m.98674 type:complete len:341 (-) Transcript_30352:2832-3854(-)